ncbi:MAG: DUF3240 family protein [Thiohalocapsa sp.]|jgi:hypothetical protein|uniref:DUF3240 family protein n=1 Tax=Thiohalocapsa sp. TaxID=2497641 RepID=UPI0025E11CDB|nr:DUF3240 family protein [Thiohalocapsa sp.]MCG6943164.1 DUF3240 family protein [Thiohalocapsa sp.]
MSDSLLHLIVPTSIEDALVEWLLERDDVPGFSSLPISGHGSSEHSMSLAEQVAGRTRRVLFLLQLPQPVAERVLAALQSDFAGTGLHWWLTPVLAAGRLD